jgi:hypothetical protein
MPSLISEPSFDVVQISEDGPYFINIAVAAEL